MPARTSASWAAVASGPMRTSSSSGLPIFSAPSRSASRRRRRASLSWGTRTRRIAVHFWPVFCVISRTTSARNRLPASPARSTSGPSTAALSESASMLIRAGADLAAQHRRGRAAAGERDDVRRASRDRAAHPRGRSASAARRGEAAARTAARAGARPARWRSRASRSPASRRPAHMPASRTCPSAGKLNALMWTATPARDAHTCWPAIRAVRPTWIGSPSASSLWRAELGAEVGVVRQRDGGRRRCRTSRRRGCCRRSRSRARSAPRARRGSPWRGRRAARHAARTSAPRGCGPRPRGRTRKRAARSWPPMATSATGASVAGLTSACLPPDPFDHAPARIAGEELHDRGSYHGVIVVAAGC